MSSTPPDKITSVFQPIAAVIGMMMAFFGLLQVILPSGLAQPIGTAGAGLVLTWALVILRRWTWNTAGITWLGTSLFLVIFYLISSQPPTVVGYAIKSDGTPLSGITLILTNSAGVDQKTISDKDGRFEVKGVPDGRYSITYNQTLVYSGEIPTGLRRMFALNKINIGSYPIQIAALSKFTGHQVPGKPPF